MNPTVVSRQKIERYAQLLEDGDHSRDYPLSSSDDGLSDLVAVGRDLQHMGRVVRTTVRGPSESFRLQTRALLMATIAREGLGARPLTPEKAHASAKGTRARTTRGARAGRAATLHLGRRVRVRVALLAGLAAGTLALSGMSAASDSAMPGDTLYGVKRSQEEAQIALAASPESKGKLYLRFAAVRLNEAGAVYPDLRLLSSTLADMENETELGVSLLASDAVRRHNSGSLTLIAQFAQSQGKALDTLLDRVGPNNMVERGRVLSSAMLLEHVKLRATEVRDAFDCNPIVVVKTDRLGPKPAQSCEHSAPSGSAPFLPGGRPGR